MYNKLFSSILDSSIWIESTPTRIVWVTFLAAMDGAGFVRMACAENVANRARVTLEEANTAIQSLESPDRVNPDEQDFEGRRIERVPGGWMVLNAKKYREIVTAEVQREQIRLRVARHRAKRVNVTDVTKCNEKLTPSEAEAEAEAEGNVLQSRTLDDSRPVRAKWQVPTESEVQLRAQTIGLPTEEANRFINYYESNGWRVGKNPMRSWPHALNNWKIKWKENRNDTRKSNSPDRNEHIVKREEGRAERILAARAKAAGFVVGEQMALPQDSPP